MRRTRPPAIYMNERVGGSMPCGPAGVGRLGRRDWSRRDVRGSRNRPDGCSPPPAVPGRLGFRAGDGGVVCARLRLATVFRGLLHYVPGRVGAGPLEYVAPEGAAAWVTVAAAAILLGLGLQMVKGKGGSLRLVPGPVAVKGVWSLLGLAALVSVDAVSAGLSLGMLDAARAGRAVAVVGAVNGAMAFLGLGLGRKMRSALHRRLRSAGGFILIALALKLLFHRF